MAKKRLDDLLIERNLAPNREEALKLIMSGEVMVQSQRAVSPSQMFPPDAAIEMKGKRQYVGRGGEKLAYAIKTFGIIVEGKTCLDIGSSTGGFTDVLLQNGARKVYAVESGKGILDLKLREDPRVVVMEGVNILHLESLPEPADILSIDVSLTSLKNVFSVLPKFLATSGEVLALFKPQYEVSDKRFLRNGIVEDAAVREQTLSDFLGWLTAHGWRIIEKAESPIKGSEGNTEYLLHIKPQ